MSIDCHTIRAGVKKGDQKGQKAPLTTFRYNKEKLRYFLGF